uniref:Uncharacterized protein n=1 Tax=Arundo donax TaxID=35708 RepID=A0A0A9CU38_ARUDO
MNFLRSVSMYSKTR